MNSIRLKLIFKMKALILVSITILLAIDFSNTQGSWEYLPMLCNDTTVSDDKLTGWSDAQRKCGGEFHKAYMAEKDDCEQVSTYVNDKVKEPNHKRLMYQTCSAEYRNCTYKAPDHWQDAHKEKIDAYHVSLIF